MRVNGDRLERAFHNAAPGAINRSFSGHVYHQSPNLVRSSLGFDNVDMQVTSSPLGHESSIPGMLSHGIDPQYGEGSFSLQWGEHGHHPRGRLPPAC